MLAARLAVIDEAYLKSLIGGGPNESRTLDYKVMFSRSGAIDGEEFRKDVVAFANTVGGDLVIGVSESKGKPTKILGIDCLDSDKLIRNIDTALREIDPRFTGYQPKIVLLTSGKVAVVLRVVRSWLAPHRTKRIDGAFMYRTNSGHEHMNIDQIREAFVTSTGLESKLQQFRTHRLADLGANAPVPLTQGLRAVLHIMPLVSATTSNLIDVVGTKAVLHKEGIIQHSWADTGINFEALRGFEWVIPRHHSGSSMQVSTLRRRYSSSRRP